jgi:hypothetical protein
MNPDDHREDNRRTEAALDRSAPGVIGNCFPMFTFRFHVQLAAKQHRTCTEYV